MTITLMNNTHRMRVFILKHEELCECIGECRCVIFEVTKKRYASVLSIPSRAWVEGLPKEILEVAQIKAALAVGDLTAKVERAKKISEQKPAKKKKRKTKKSA